MWVEVCLQLLNTINADVELLNVWVGTVTHGRQMTAIFCSEGTTKLFVENGSFPMWIAVGYYYMLYVAVLSQAIMLFAQNNSVLITLSFFLWTPSKISTTTTTGNRP